ncbi:MAG: type I-U CRISPR-associated protein Csb2 [Methanomassiliicoccales archaeon]
MLTLSLRFPAGAYHATPWGAHVNEAQKEWPPSPWRIMRAMLATWKRRASDIKESIMREIMIQLCAEPPSFLLPKVSVGHSRHYVPWIKSSKSTKGLIFDDFVAISKNATAFIYWPNAIISKEGKEALSTIVSKLSYLGRAESWCEVKVVEIESEELILLARSNGLYLVEPASKNREMLDGSGEGLIRRILTPLPINGDKQLTEKHVLMISTNELRNELNQLTPPGAFWEEYYLPEGCIDDQPSPVPPSTTCSEKIRAIRYSLDAPALPPVTKTLRVAERVRAACMSIYGGEDRKKSEFFSGKNESGEPLKGHPHAYFLPSDDDLDGKLDHLLVFSHDVISDDHVSSLRNLKRLSPRGSEMAIGLLLVEESSAEEGASPLLSRSRIWESCTPFLLSRHPKTYRNGIWKTIAKPERLVIDVLEGTKRDKSSILVDYGVSPDLNLLQKDGPLHQLLSSLEIASFPKPLRITILPELRMRGSVRRWSEFQRTRSNGMTPCYGPGYGFRIEFDEEVPGPIAVGFACHEGMGMFRPLR